MAWLVGSCREQGVPLVLRDPETLRTVASLMNPPPAVKRRRRASRPARTLGDADGGPGTDDPHSAP